ncbi:MAG: hypothetical protein ACK4S2_13955 [Gemmobacter sp.]|uniref:hypothetical protein n=1 Tax=Gemmobacter sp. TaxID=1898957 RepID=UPI00391AA313
MKFPFVLAIAILAPLSAKAGLTADRLTRDFAAAGYGRIEVEQRRDQLKVEAWNDTHKIEAIYDIQTGALLKTETAGLKDLDDPRRAHSDDRRGDDRKGRGRGRDGDDDRMGDDDHGPGHDAGDDHGSGHDDGGNDDGPGHDAGDDHGADD